MDGVFPNRFVAKVCIYAIAFALITLVPAMAKDEPLGWDNVARLREGATVHVKLFNKQAHKGKVTMVEPNGITLSTKGVSLLLLKEDIRSVAHYARPHASVAGALVAAGGVGLSAAALSIGTVQDASQLSRGQLTGSTGRHHVGLAIAGIGIAVGGLAILVFGGMPKTIYEAASPAVETRKKFREEREKKHEQLEQ